MEHKPDTIMVSAFQKEEIDATHADLHVTVKGSSLVSGNEAMKKAKEVNQLFEALRQVGVKEESIHLQGVHIDSSSGALLKSSSAAYSLKIHCEDLNLLARLLDVITSQKNASLGWVEWKYNDEEIREQLLLKAIDKAKGKADKISNSLGVRLLGVYDLREDILDSDYQGHAKREMGVLRAQSIPASPTLELEIQHSKTIHVNVNIWYRVSEF